MYGARALSYLVLFLNSMKINEVCSHDFKVLHVSVYVAMPFSLRYQPPMLACTVWLGKRSASDDDWWTRNKRLQKCGVLPSMDTVRTVSFTGISIISIVAIEIPRSMRSTQVVAIAWVYGTPMLLWQQEALAVRQGLLPWELFHPGRSCHPSSLDLCLCLPYQSISSDPQISTATAIHSYP